MKKTLILVFALAFAGALIAAEAPKPVEAPKPDPVAELTKERDELKTKLTTAEQQAGALQAQNQYLAVLAERNEMAVRLLQANGRADDLQKQLDAEKAKTAELEKKIEAAKPIEKKP